MVTTEIIAYTLADAKTAASCGANRLEVIASPAEGGLTPSLGLVQLIREQVDLDIRVMIRPHSRSFIYNQEDLLTMERDIAVLCQHGATGFVLGLLTPRGTIDEPNLARLLEAAQGLPVTFHRAIDESVDLEQSLITLGSYPQITHVLTSGGRSSVLEAVDTISRLQVLSKQTGITLLPDAGLHPEALEPFLKETAVHEIHMGSGVRIDGNILQPIDSEKLTRVIRIADRH